MSAAAASSSASPSDPEAPAELECVRDRARAGALLHPLRLAILERAGEPRSAAEIAALLGEPRQKVNYHVHELARAGLLRQAGSRRKRNLREQLWRATARSYLLDPGLLGPLHADAGRVADRLSAAHLLGLSARLQRELGRSSEHAAGQGKRISTLSMDAEIRFESAEQRARFGQALQDAVLRVVAEHSSPASDPSGGPGRGRPFRMLVGCYPVPAEDSGSTAAGKAERGGR